MQLDEPGPSRATDRRIPHLVVMSERVIIQEHHHSSINRYMWESDVTNSYSKSTLDFNNSEDMCGEITDKDERNNHRP